MILVPTVGDSGFKDWIEDWRWEQGGGVAVG